MGKLAILLGASGLIGSHLLSILLNNDAYDKVVLFVRKKLPISHQKLEQVITSFDNLSTLDNKIKADVLFCCLGSTKKKTPNLADYKYVDYDIPLYFAEKGILNGLEQYNLVSAIGADAKSSNFYTKLKGELEDSLKSLKFDSLIIYQPSFLKGERTENRPLEKIMLPIMKVIDLFLIGSLKKYRSIEAEDVAKAMFNESIKNKRGIFVHNSEQIKVLA